MKIKLSGVGSLALTLLSLQVPCTALAIDWSKVTGTDITVFYPGQASWEWVLTKSDHDGAADIRKGKTCWDCHEGEEKDMGSKIVPGEKLEPNPVAGKRPAFDVNVKAAHDGENLYVRMAWPEGEAKSSEKEDPEHEAKATIFIGDKSIVAFDRGGCWSACHDDLVGMPSDQGKGLTKYLAESRTKITRQGGGESYKSGDELAKLLGDGTFIEFWQARLNKGSASPVGGYVLDKLHEGEPPTVSVQGGLEDGQWVVVFTRKLNAGGAGQRQFGSGAVIPIGIAVHDDYAKGRRHHVSFKRTLALDKGDADIVAEKQ